MCILSISPGKLTKSPSTPFCYRALTTYKKCDSCNNEFLSLVSENRKYCSSSCAAKINNKKHIKRTKKNQINNECKNCGNITDNGKIYCNLKCFQEHRKNKIYKEIENGNTKLNSNLYRNYLIDRYGKKCMECGWGKENPKTKRIPIELEHIDGNSDNNHLINLKLLCPNCHSLTPTYKGANRGNGRYERKERFLQCVLLALLP